MSSPIQDSLGASNTRANVSALSSALSVMMSSFPAHFSILDMLGKKTSRPLTGLQTEKKHQASCLLRSATASLSRSCQQPRVQRGCSRPQGLPTAAGPLRRSPDPHAEGRAARGQGEGGCGRHGAKPPRFPATARRAHGAASDVTGPARALRKTAREL